MTMTPEEILEHNRVLASKVKKQEVVVEDLAEQLKRSKAKLKRYSAQLLADSLDTPLFVDDSEPAPTEPPADDAWRGIGLGDIEWISLPEQIVGKLAEAEITTLGQFADFQADKGDFWAKDIEGIGAKARQTIEEALEAFWTKWFAEHPPEDTDDSQPSEDEEPDDAGQDDDSA